MQQDYELPATIFIRPIFLGLFLLSLLPSSGCGERPTTIDPVPPQPYRGVTLKLAASHPSDRGFLHQLTRGWAKRTGAEVVVVEDLWDGSADIGLVSPAEMPRWAEGGQLAEVPDTLRQPANSYRWDDLNSIYTVRLTSWGTGAYFLPVLGEGLVMVYRKDAFQKEDSIPMTWEELLETARRLGPNSLPPLPTDPEQLSAEFFSAAACYESLAVGSLGKTIREDFFAFQFDPTTGAPQLDRPSFSHVAALFQKMGKFRSSAPTAAAAFEGGDCKIGILSLKQLGQIPSRIKEHIGIAPLPGSRTYYDEKDRPQTTDQGTINRIPYLGWGGRVGVVSAKCAASEAAWNLLAELGMPDRMALDLIAAPKWGGGPYRTSQLDNRALPRWFAYELSATETERLTAALRENLGQTVLNYRVRLRTPNQHELAIAFDEEFRKALKSDQPANLTPLNGRWKSITQKMPEGEWKRVLRMSLGF